MAGRKPKTAQQNKAAKDFGRLVRSARKRKKWSQSELADEVGVHRVTISRIENGHEEASPLLKRKIARELGFMRLINVDPERAEQLIEDLLRLSEDDHQLLQLERDAQNVRQSIANLQAELQEIEGSIAYARRRTRENPATQRLAETLNASRARVGDSVDLPGTDLDFLPEIFARLGTDDADRSEIQLPTYEAQEPNVWNFRSES